MSARDSDFLKARRAHPTTPCGLIRLVRSLLVTVVDANSASSDPIVSVAVLAIVAPGVPARHQIASL